MNLLFSLLILSLPLGVLTRLQIFNNSFIYLHDVIATVIFLVFIYRLLVKKINISNKNIFANFMIFIAVGFTCLLINLTWLNLQNFFVSLLYLIRYVIYGSLIFSSGLIEQKYLKNINIYLIISGFVFTAFGYLQYFFYPNLRNLYYAGWDDHLYRLFSTMLDPNFAGIFLVLFFILILSNLFASIERANKYSVIIFSFLGMFSIISIYLTHSRSALVALIVGIMVLLFIKRQAKIVIPVIILTFAGLIVFSNTKIEGLNPLRIASAEARLESAKDALTIIQKNLLTGVGFDAYRYAQIKYGLRTASPKIIANADAGTDNSYLFVLATTGIVGFLVFSRYLYGIIVRLRKNKGKDVLSMAALSSFAALLVNTFLINSLFYPLIMIWIFIIIGVSIKGSKKQ